MKTMYTFRKFLLIAAGFMFLFSAEAQNLKPVKYVFMFIGDGMSYPQREATNRYLKAEGKAPLFIDSLPYSRSTCTIAANNVVTDSAASGTAIASGSKTKKGYLGLDQEQKPLYSCAVTAQKAGRKVGILTTVTINNATPAAYYGHQNNRHNYYLLGVELADSGFDYFAGGAVADSHPGSKARPENIPELKKQVENFTAEIEACRKVNDGLNQKIKQAQSEGDKAKMAELRKEKQNNSRKWAKFHNQRMYAQRNLKIAENYVGNIIDYARKKGYKVITSRSKQQLSALKPNGQKILAYGKLQNGGTIPWAIDAEGDPEATSLAFLTAKGIELLDNPNGFFMMVEGGKIDWACHGNDAGTLVREMIAFDEAVKVAAEFAKTHPDTLIVVTGDHETGGLSFRGDLNAAPLRAQKHSADYFCTQLRRLKRSKAEDKVAKAKQLVTDVFGLQFEGTGLMAMNKDEKNALEGALYRELGEKSAVQSGFYSTAEAAIKAGKNPGAAAIATLLVSRRAGLEWNTKGHSALPVRTTAMGAQAEQFLAPSDLSAKQKTMHHKHDPKIPVPIPEIDNSDIGKRMHMVVAPLKAN